MRLNRDRFVAPAFTIPKLPLDLGAIQLVPIGHQHASEMAEESELTRRDGREKAPRVFTDRVADRGRHHSDHCGDRDP